MTENKKPCYWGSMGDAPFCICYEGTPNADEYMGGTWEECSYCGKWRKTIKVRTWWK